MRKRRRTCKRIVRRDFRQIPTTRARPRVPSRLPIVSIVCKPKRESNSRLPVSTPSSKCSSKLSPKERSSISLLKTRKSTRRSCATSVEATKKENYLWSDFQSRSRTQHLWAGFYHETYIPHTTSCSPRTLLYGSQNELLTFEFINLLLQLSNLHLMTMLQVHDQGCLLLPKCYLFPFSFQFFFDERGIMLHLLDLLLQEGKLSWAGCWSDLFG
mmetsp:Transcript_3004/g.11511  ORF Transcript_3004/g.11511 Transcript_3004/m.11511 type:complete len:214 (-) Transcript_3004:3378-4019(-)